MKNPNLKGVRRVTVLAPGASQTVAPAARSEVAAPNLNLGKGVRRVSVLETTPAGFNRAVVIHGSRRKRKKQSKSLRPMEKAMRKLSKAQAAAAEEYGARHRKANRRKKNGWARKLPDNVIKAQKKFWKKIR